jgi:hypothetical protein
VREEELQPERWGDRGQHDRDLLGSADEDRPVVDSADRHRERHAPETARAGAAPEAVKVVPDETATDACVVWAGLDPALKARTTRTSRNNPFDRSRLGSPNP